MPSIGPSTWHALTYVILILTPWSLKLSFPFHRLGNKGTGKLNNLLKFSQLVSDKAGIWNMPEQFQSVLWWTLQSSTKWEDRWSSLGTQAPRWVASSFPCKRQKVTKMLFQAHNSAKGKREKKCEKYFFILNEKKMRKVWTSFSFKSPKSHSQLK